MISDDAGDNPFAVGQSIAHAARDLGATERQDSTWRVQNELVKVGPNSALPEACIVTGSKQHLIERTRSLSWCPIFVLLTCIFLLPVGLVLYMFLRKSCRIRYFISRKARTSHRILIFWACVCLISTFVLIAVLVDNAIVDSVPLLPILPAALFLTALVLLARGLHPIGVQRFEKPATFWLYGCQQPFLEHLAKRSTTNED